MKPAASLVVDTALHGQTDTSLADLAEQLISAFGGPSKLATAYKLEFDNAKEGGMSRQRLLEGVLRLVSQAGAHKQAPPVENLSDEELQQHLVDLLTRRGLVSSSTESAGSGSTLPATAA